MKDINCYLNPGELLFKVKFEFCVPSENRKLKTVGAQPCSLVVIITEGNYVQVVKQENSVK